MSENVVWYGDGFRGEGYWSTYWKWFDGGGGGYGDVGMAKDMMGNESMEKWVWRVWVISDEMGL